MGERLAGLSVPALDLRCAGLRAECRHGTWVGGGWSAASGEGRVLSERTGRGGFTGALQSGWTRRQRRREERTGCRIRAQETCARCGILAAGDEVLCVRAEQRESARGRAERTRNRSHVVRIG